MHSALTIALAHPEVIPPARYGGTERVIAHLAAGLVALGHRVVLMSARGSAIPGCEWVELPRDADPLDRVPEGIDLLHLWTTPSREPKQPYLVTIGGNGKPGERYCRNTVFVSSRQARNHGAIHFVHNGVDPALYRAEPRRGRHLVFLSKASWSVKNLPGAIEVARLAGRPLEVIGNRGLPFGLDRLRPRIRGVRYHGMLTDSEKAEILRDAHGLVFPVRWHEPFGVAVAEALLSGCPVFATPYGSLPEIVGEQVGFLTNSARAMAEAVNARTYDPAVCREWAVERFSEAAMAKRYVELYREVRERGGLVGTPEDPERGIPAPVCRETLGFSAQELLPWLP